MSYMKSIYDVIVEDLGSKKAWGSLVYQEIGRDRYEDLTYDIKVAAAKSNIEIGQQIADNGEPINTYPEDWLRTKLNEELGKLGFKTIVKVKSKNTLDEFKILLQDVFGIFFSKRVYQSGRKKGEIYYTLSTKGKLYFMDACCARLLLKTLSCSYYTDVYGGYVLESELCRRLKRKNVTRTFSYLQTENGWVIENLHGTGRYRVGERSNKFNDPAIEKVNKLVRLAINSGNARIK